MQNFSRPENSTPAAIAQMGVRPPSLGGKGWKTYHQNRKVGKSISRTNNGTTNTKTDGWAKPSQQRKGGTTVTKAEKWAKGYQKRRIALLSHKLKADDDCPMHYYSAPQSHEYGIRKINMKPGAS
jgi:hypothetical protein